MTFLDSSLLYSGKTSTLDKIARISFWLYLFFVIFGTSEPFPSATYEREQIITSNPLNQLLSLLFLASVISLWGKQDEVLAFIKREKFLTLLLVWMLISVTWSLYPSVSLKRWISLLGETVICFAALIRFKWSEEALRYFRSILFIYLPLSLLSVLFVYEATQWEFPAWRALTPTKNNLGQLMLFSIIVWLAIIPYNKGRAINVLHFAMLGMAAILYLGARSTTSFLVGLILLLLLGTYYAARWIGTPGLARFYGTSVVLTGGGAMLLILLFAPDYLAQFFGFFGKDMTFTGRVELWDTVYTMVLDRIWIGWGIGGFWVMDGSHLRPLFEQFVWIPNQAHEGYIDMLSQTGIVGLALLVGMIVGYFRRLTLLSKKQVWKWLFLAILILNFQESVFFRPRNPGHFLFIFSYVALFVDAYKERNESNQVTLGPVEARNLEI